MTTTVLIVLGAAAFLGAAALVARLHRQIFDVPKRDKNPDEPPRTIRAKRPTRGPKL